MGGVSGDLDPHTVLAIVCVTFALLGCALLFGLINGKPDE